MSSEGEMLTYTNTFELPPVSSFYTSSEEKNPWIEVKSLSAAKKAQRKENEMRFMQHAARQATLEATRRARVSEKRVVGMINRAAASLAVTKGWSSFGKSSEAMVASERVIYKPGQVREKKNFSKRTPSKKLLNPKAEPFIPSSKFQPTTRMVNEEAFSFKDIAQLSPHVEAALSSKADPKFSAPTPEPPPLVPPLPFDKAPIYGTFVTSSQMNTLFSRSDTKHLAFKILDLRRNKLDHEFVLGEGAFSVLVSAIRGRKASERVIRSLIPRADVRVVDKSKPFRHITSRDLHFPGMPHPKEEAAMKGYCVRLALLSKDKRLIARVEKAALTKNSQEVFNELLSMTPKSLDFVTKKFYGDLSLQGAVPSTSRSTTVGDAGGIPLNLNIPSSSDFDFLFEHSDDFPGLLDYVSTLVALHETRSVLGWIAILVKHFRSYSLVRNMDKWLTQKLLLFLNRLKNNNIEQQMLPGDASVEIPEPPNFQSIFSWFSEHRSSLPTDAQFTSFTNDWVTQPFCAMKESSLSYAFFDLLSMFSIQSVVRVLNIPYLSEAMENFRSVLLKVLKNERKTGEVVDTFMSKLFRMCREAVTKLQQCFKERSFSPLFDRIMSVDDLIIHSEYLLFDALLSEDNSKPGNKIEFEKRVLKGEVPSRFTFQLSIPKRLEFTEEFIDGCDKYLLVSQDHLLRQRLSSLREKLVSHKFMTTNNVADGSLRIQPFAVYIHGFPGVGKTTIANEINLSLLRRIGIDAKSHNIMRLQDDSNFYDKATPETLAVMCNDLDAKPVAAAPGQRDHVQTVLQLVDTAFLDLEQAGVDKKGKVSASFLTCTYTTNYEFGNLTNFAYAPTQLAFWRRFKYKIRMSVKKDFATALGAVDESKVTFTHGQYSEEVFDFHVAKWNGEKFDSPLVLSSVGGLISFLGDAFVPYYEKQKSRLYEIHSTKRCSRCCRDYVTTRCGCISIIDKNNMTENHGLELQLAPLPEASFNFSHVLFFLAILYILDTNLVYWVAAVLVSIWAVQTLINLVGVENFKKLLWQYAIVTYLSKMGGWKYSLINYFAEVTPTGVLVWRENMCLANLVGTKIGPNISTVVGISLVALALRGLVSFFRGKLVHQAISPDGDPVILAPRDSWTRFPLESTRVLSNVPSDGVSLKDLAVMVQNEIYEVTTTRGTVMGFMIKPTVMVTVKHCVFDMEEALITRGTFRAVVKLKSCCIHSRDKDWSLIWCPEIFPPKYDFSKYLLNESEITTFDKGLLPTVPQRTASPVYPFNYPLGGYVGGYSAKYQIPTIKGDCGVPLLVQRGRSLHILGVHHALDNESGLSITTGFSYGEFERYLREAESKFQWLISPVAVDSLSMNLPKGVVLQQLPKKSSVAVSVTNETPFYVMGTAVPPICGSTMRSKVEDTWFREDLVELEKSTGNYPAFYPPVFKGKIIDEQWVDPYTVNFSKFNNKGGDWDTWTRAIGIYLSGVEKCVGRDACRPVTLRDALLGIVGTDLGGTNWTSSAGLLYPGSKANYFKIKRDDKGIVIDVEVNQQLMEEVESIIEITTTKIYPAVALHVLKDEPLSKSKHDSLKNRVFNVVGFPYNLVLKMKLAPVTSFLRLNTKYFQSAIGSNVCDVKTVSDWKAHLFNPQNQYFAGDRSDYDVTASSREMVAVISLIERICRILDYSSEEITITTNLLWGCVYTYRVIKNDVIALTFTMPSGFWITILINTLRNLLQFCYAWASLGYKSPIRNYFCGFLLGDDNLNSFYDPTNSIVFDQQVVNSIFKEFGGVMTSPSKGQELKKYESFEQSSFLKRRITLLEGVVVAPIEEKTLIKMLCIRTRSQLSPMEHHCETISNVLRESWMLGRERFVFYQRLCSLLIQKYSLKGSNLRVKEFDEYFLEYKKGGFVTWTSTNHETSDNKLELQVCPLRIERINPQTRMSELASDLHAAQGSETKLMVPKSTQLIEQDVIVVPNPSAQGTPGAEEDDISDVLKRWIRLTINEIRDSDEHREDITTLTPWSDIISNPEIIKALSPYAGISGTIEVMFKPTCPGSCSGIYVVSLLCRAGDTEIEPGFTSKTGYVYNQAYEDNHAIINCEFCNPVIVECPWVHASKQFYPLILGASDPWLIELYCEAPLLSTISSTPTVGKVEVYIRFKEYKLHGLSLQMKDPKRNLKASDVVSTAARFSSQYSGAVGTGLSALSTVMDWFGYSREARQEQPTQASRCLGGNVALVDGSDGSNNVGLYGDCSVGDDFTYCQRPTNEDLMSFESLFSRWRPVTHFECGVDGALSHVLPVSPFYDGYYFKTLTDISYTPSVAGYVGLPFTYWRGDMEYLIRVSSSSNVKGQLLVMFDPYSNANVANMTASAIHRLNNVVIDLTGSSSTLISVGYSASEFVKNVMPLAHSSPRNSETEKGTAGVIHFSLLTPVLAPKSTYLVHITVFARAKSNMRFYLPSNIVSKINASGEKISTNELYLQMAPPDPGRNLTADLVETNGNFQAKECLFGEEVLSVRAMMQKFCAFSRFDLVNGVNVYHFPALPSGCSPAEQQVIWRSDQSKRINFNYTNYYGSIFIGIRGGSRFKIYFEDPFESIDSNFIKFGVIPFTDAELGLNAVSALDLFFGTYSSQVGDIIGLWQDSFAEFVIPQQGSTAFEKVHRDLQLPTALALPFSRFVRAFALVLVNSGGGLYPPATGAIGMMQAMASDVGCSRYRRTPSIIMPF